MYISNNYYLVWRLKSTPNYQFTKNGICINVKTGNLIRKILVGSTKGYCINGKFRSISQLKKELELIPYTDCPF